MYEDFIINEIVNALKDLSHKEPKIAKILELRVVKLINANSSDVLKGRALIKELYEDYMMRESVNKVQENKNSGYVKKNSRIGRINRRKALFDMTFNIRKIGEKLDKEILIKVQNIEDEVKLPSDYDINQTAKIRDDFVYIKNGKLCFHILSEGKDITRAIKLEDNIIIFLGKDSLFKYEITNDNYADDKVHTLGVMPNDSIYYIKDGLVFLFDLTK